MAPVVTATLATGIGPTVTEAPRAVPDAALTRAVTSAVNQLNSNGLAGQGREVTIALDPVTRQPVVRLVDATTHEVLQQWPSKYVLQLAEDYKSRGYK